MENIKVKIEPFTGHHTYCPKCGNGSENQLVHGVGDFNVHPSMRTALRVRYCAGGKEPEETEQNPLSAFLQLIAADAISSKFRTLSLTRVNICAGIGEEHLHVQCVDCGYEWLTQTKEQSMQKIAGVA